MPTYFAIKCSQQTIAIINRNIYMGRRRSDLARHVSLNRLLLGILLAIYREVAGQTRYGVSPRYDAPLKQRGHIIPQSINLARLQVCMKLIVHN